MYESPIKIIESTIDSIYKDIVKKKDDAIFAEIQSSFGVDLDRGELIRALQYDRNQYKKGHLDGVAEATPKWIPVTERLTDLELVAAKANDLHAYPCLCVVKDQMARGGRYVTKLFYNGENFMDGDMWPWTVKTTHWMPLPEPPKE